MEDGRKWETKWKKMFKDREEVRKRGGKIEGKKSFEGRRRERERE